MTITDALYCEFLQKELLCARIFVNEAVRLLLRHYDLKKKSLHASVQLGAMQEYGCHKEDQGKRKLLERGEIVSTASELWHILINKSSTCDYPRNTEYQKLGSYQELQDKVYPDDIKLPDELLKLGFEPKNTTQNDSNKSPAQKANDSLDLVSRKLNDIKNYKKVLRAEGSLYGFLGDIGFGIILVGYASVLLAPSVPIAMCIIGLGLLIKTITTIARVDLYFKEKKLDKTLFFYNRNDGIFDEDKEASNKDGNIFLG